jgi:hypothetical protein
MIHVGQNIIDVIGSSLIWGLLAVFTAQVSSVTRMGGILTFFEPMFQKRF